MHFSGLENTIFTKFCPRYALGFTFSPFLNKCLVAPMNKIIVFLVSIFNRVFYYLGRGRVIFQLSCISVLLQKGSLYLIFRIIFLNLLLAYPLLNWTRWLKFGTSLRCAFWLFQLFTTSYRVFRFDSTSFMAHVRQLRLHVCIIFCLS